MPNGRDSNWVRLMITLRGFHSRCGDWPVRVRLKPAMLKDLRSLFRPETFARLTEKLELIPDKAEGVPALVAEDDAGDPSTTVKVGLTSTLRTRPTGREFTQTPSSQGKTTSSESRPRHLR